MPDPKDYMDNDHVYVQGHVRRKSGESPIGHRRRSWFWNIAWYWRLLIFVGILVGFVIALVKNIYIVFGLILAVFVLLFLRQSAK